MARKTTATLQEAAPPPLAAPDDVAIHIPARAFRKRLASLAKNKQVVVVGQHRRMCGVFVPVDLAGWPDGLDGIHAATKSLNKVTQVDRYREESE